MDQTLKAWALASERRRGDNSTYRFFEDEIRQEFAQLSHQGDMDMVSCRARKKPRRTVKAIKKENEKEKEKEEDRPGCVISRSANR